MSRLTILVACSVFQILLGLVAAPVQGQPCHLATLAPIETGPTMLQLGRSLTVQGDLAVVSTPFSQTNCSPGQVLIYRWIVDAWVEEQTLVPPDGYRYDWFGYSVSISNDRIVIGSPRAGLSGIDETGAAYVFRFEPTTGQWEFEQKLLGSDDIDGAYFGISVSISGDVVAVGASGQTITTQGATYVFRRDPLSSVWSEEEKLFAVSTPYDFFGYSVCCQGDQLLVGAPTYDGLATDAGAAFVYGYDGVSWQPEQTLLAPGGAAYDRFGWSVALSGDVALIGSPGDGGVGISSGSAYFFRYGPGTDWAFEQKALSIPAVVAETYGSTVALNGNVAVVASSTLNGPTAIGVADVYRWDSLSASWLLEQRLAPSVPFAGTNFGTSAAIGDGQILVGASTGDGLVLETGSVHPFEFEAGSGSWVEQPFPLLADGAEGDWFGAAVAADGDRVLIGAPHDRVRGQFSGSAVIYERDALGGWQLQQSFAPVDGDGLFGEDVDLEGDVAVVGAPLGREGAAMVYRYNSVTEEWEFEQRLTNPIIPTTGPISDYGEELVLQGEWIMVGDPGAITFTGTFGSVTIFRYDATAGTWALTQTLAPPGFMDAFGVALAISGDIAVVGSRYDSVIEGGAAYVYRFNPACDEWQLEQTLQSPDVDTLDRFGSSLAIHDGELIIGSYLSDRVATDAGAVYTFREDGSSWQLSQVLTPTEIEAGDGFGYSLSAYQGRLAIGCTGDDDTFAGSGSVYLYGNDASGGPWFEQAKIVEPVPGADVYFGTALSQADDYLVVGVFSDNEACPDCPYSNSGTVQLFEFEACFPARSFVRGDANGDTVIDIGDAVFTLSHLFAGGPGLCLDAGDSNDDGAVDVGDPIFVLAFLFSLGPPPPTPFPTCGLDLTPDTLTCYGPPCP